MSDTTGPIIGFLHPGKMGSAMASALTTGIPHWTGDRSPATARRAAAASMTVMPLPEMLSSAAVIVSICPPDAAVDTASQVAGIGFDGIYVDANAIAPATARSIAEQFDRFVDGSVVGPPPVDGRIARLYLSGQEAQTVADLWEGSALEPRIVGETAGPASAVKMGYAGYTKGLAALVLNIHAYADAEGIAVPLLTEFVESQPAFEPASTRARGPVIGKAWRFAGEMDEIASSYEAQDLPGDFWSGAADVYRRLAAFRDADPAPPFNEVIEALQQSVDPDHNEPCE